MYGMVVLVDVEVVVEVVDVDVLVDVEVVVDVLVVVVERITKFPTKTFEVAMLWESTAFTLKNTLPMLFASVVTVHPIVLEFREFTLISLKSILLVTELYTRKL